MTNKKVLVIDHQDSFTNNLVAELNCLGVSTQVVCFPMNTPFPKVEIYKHLEQGIEAAHALVLSAGPGHPQDYAYEEFSLWLKKYRPEMPVFGVCLGMQLLLHWEGFPIEMLFSVESKSREGLVVHGRTEPISDLQTLPYPFEDVSSTTRAVFYNSLGLKLPGLHSRFEKILHPWSFVLSPLQPYAVNIACHRESRRFGVQFHPESFATPNGTHFFGAFLKLV